jgi:hypothetical protein
VFFMTRMIKAGCVGLAFLLGCSATPPTPQEDVARPAQVAAPAASADMKLFQSPDGDFQLEYPASWQLLPSTADLRFHARNLLGLVSANVATQQVPPGTTLDAFADSSIESLKSAVEMRRPVERTTITLHGTPAVRLGVIAVAPLLGPAELHWDVIVAVVGNKGYALTCGTGTAQAATAKPTFDRIIASMRFTK